MQQRIRWLSLAVLAVACLSAPVSGQAADPLYIRQWLGVGNWADLAADRQVLDSGDLPFEGRMTRGRLWTVVTARDDGFVDLNVLGPTSPETALAHVYLFSDQEKPYRLLIGCDDRARVYLNGKLIGQAKRAGAWKPDQETLNLTLAKGWNRLLIRVESEAALFGFSARVTLPDGRPATLKTSVPVPPELADEPQLKKPLSAEDVSELLELLDSRINAAAYQAGRMVRTWEEEGPALHRGYAAARTCARAYVESLHLVLATLPAARNEKDEAARREKAEQARQQLLAAAVAGPQPLVERTRAFLDQARRGERLWEMVRFAATTAHQAGRQAAEVDQALVAARSLLTAVAAEYLRPSLLDERTLACRTAEVTVQLSAREDGSPLSEAEISVEQLSHEFVFGGNLFAWGQFPNQEDEKRYREQFVRLFNAAVVPMYWSLTEPAEGRLDYTRDTRGLPGPELIIQWCRSRGLRVEAGPILAGGIFPAWLSGKSPDDLAKLVEAHVRETVGRFKGQVDVWDLCNDSYPTLSVGRLRLPVSYVVAWARQADPQAGLRLSHTAPHAIITAWQLNARQPFGLTGVQWNARQEGGAWSMLETESQLDRLRTNKCPTWIGRVMIPGAARDEELQARQVEAFYRTAFAHPAVRGVTWWDLSDRFAQGGAPGGLLRKDLTPKPAYQVLDRLINGQWRTRTQGLADGRGKFTFRGYFGRYRLRAVLSDGLPAVWEFDLSSDGPRDIELTYPPPPPAESK